jgi:intraflagellar transport protein 172
MIVVLIRSRLLHCCHYVCLLSACRSKGGPFTEVANSIAVSLVRYCDILPADRVFYEAGQACKESGKVNQAFVLTNRFIDIAELMDDGEDTSTLENTDFEQTDVPFEFRIQDVPFITESEREEVRDWVLTMSMDQKVEPVLSMRSCYKCSTRIYEASLTCHSCQVRAKPCVVTGLPVGRGRGELAPEEVFVGFHQGGQFKDYVEFVLR